MRWSLALVAILLGACGGGHDATFDRVQGLCAAIATGTPLRDVAAQFDVPPTTLGLNLTTLGPVAGGDICPYSPTQTISLLGFQYYASDDRACRGSPAGQSCGYRCEVRIAGQPAADASNPVCAHEFVVGTQ